MGTESSFPRVKRPECEADYSPPSGTEVKNVWRSSSTPQHVFMVWYLIKHRDSFTFRLDSYLKWMYISNNAFGAHFATRYIHMVKVWRRTKSVVGCVWQFVNKLYLPYRLHCYPMWRVFIRMKRNDDRVTEADKNKHLHLPRYETESGVWIRWEWNCWIMSAVGVLPLLAKRVLDHLKSGWKSEWNWFLVLSGSLHISASS
jgi:hypothetical protein